MKKNLKVFLFSCIVLFASCSGLKHQLGFNVNSLPFNYSERGQPQYPLDPAFFYYGIQYNIPPSYRGIIDPKFLSPDFSIEGQRYTDNPRKNDVKVTVTYGPMSISDIEIREEVVEMKDEESNKVYKTRVFWVECNYGMDVNATVSKGGKTINNFPLAEASLPTVYRSKDFNNRKEALTYWDLNKDYLREDFVKIFAKNTVQSLSSILSRDYGYPIYQKAETIISINDKGIGESQNFGSQCLALQYKLSSLDGTTPLKRNDVLNLINYFKSIPEKYPDLEDKSQIRLRYAAYSNLSLIYLLLEEPDEAAEWARMVIQNGYQTNRGNALLNRATELRDYLRQHPIKTTQFTTDSYFK